MNERQRNQDSSQNATRFLTFEIYIWNWISEKSGFQKQKITCFCFVRKESWISISHGKCRFKVRIPDKYHDWRQSYIFFCHDSWHALCSWRTVPTRVPSDHPRNPPKKRSTAVRFCPPQNSSQTFYFSSFTFLFLVVSVRRSTKWLNSERLRIALLTLVYSS